MAVDHIRYDMLAQEALRGVVRTVLGDAARNGMPGEHHFYITFNTCTDGVRLSPRMREQYPKEMTIVLQHQFWDLVITENGFEVGLSFGGVPERLAVPFVAIKGFFDPSVQFGLQFEEIGEAGTHGEEPEDESALPTADRSLKRPAAEHQAHAPSALPPVPVAANPELASPEPTLPADDKPESGAEVVRLDRFRKK
jgi:uncharacterized protein